MSDVIELTKKLVEFESITPNDDGALAYIASLLPNFEAKFIEFGGVRNLYLKKIFSREKVHLCFAGHIDVVPPGQGWSSHPFKAHIQDNYLQARGAQDMKGAVAAFICACQNVKEFKGTLSIILTSDEEGEAKYGTLEVLKYLKSLKEIPNYAVVAEPTCEEKFGDIIKIGRRGSINGKLKIKGKQGHVAYPKKCVNPIHILAMKINELAGYRFDAGNDFFEASQLIITDIRGGIQATNVTANEVDLMFNVRNSNLIDETIVRDYIENLFFGFDYELSLTTTSLPFLTNKNSKIVRNLINSVYEITSINPKLSTSGGTSDARYFAQFGVEVAEFGLKNDKIHQIDEKADLDELIQLYQIFQNLIENFT